MLLLRPMWLALALPLAALALWQMRRGPDAGGWQDVMPPVMLAGMRSLGHLTTGATGWRRFLPLIALAALMLGLAGPALPRRDAPVLAQVDAVMLAVDLSPSVANGPGLVQAQVATAGLVQQLAGRPVGLILYAGESFAVSAPTADGRVLETQIAAMGPGVMPGDGSRPAAALGLAGEMLTGMKRADLVLISDGGGIDATASGAAARLAERGIRVSTLLVQATAPEAPPPDIAGMAELARLGGGAAATARDPAAVERLLIRPGLTARDPALTATQYRDLGPFLAALALLPLLSLLRRAR
ncbi:VWA domain-containing protein [Paracoccus sp. M683]|nr:VWA domain-containing protein [Paracoccus sp. M683]